MFVCIISAFLLSLSFKLQSFALKINAIDKLSKTGYIDGDFIIGAMFPIRGSLFSDANKNDPYRCDSVMTQAGVQYAEAAFYAIDAINKNEHILPGIKLGITIKDECWSEQVALYQTIKLLEKSKISKPHAPANSGKSSPVLIGILGAATSSCTYQIQSLLKLYGIPQIGYSASIMDLKYPYFFLSVVPNYYHETFVILNILKKLQWNYVSVAYTEGSKSHYTGNEKFLFQDWTSQFDICISSTILMPKASQGIMYMHAVSELFEDKRARVIVCFCEGPTISALYTEIQARNLTGHYLFLISSNWYINRVTFQGYEKEAQGSIIVEKKANYLSEFDDYFLGLNLQSNTRNPWFEEYWEFMFQCGVNADNSDLPACTGNEDLKHIYKQRPGVSYVIKSIYALAHGLHNMIVGTCNNEAGTCPELYPFNTTKYMEYLVGLEFTFQDEFVNLGFNRSPTVGGYDIFNYQNLPDGSYDKVKISECRFDFKRQQQNNFQLSPFEYFTEAQYPGGDKIPIKSSCSDPCLPVFKKLQGNGNTDKICCWSCVACLPHEILANETTCRHCPFGYWPNSKKSECVRVPIVYSNVTKWQLLAARTLSSVGIFLTLLTSYVFVTHRHTPVVKSSTPELCYLMLFGVLLMHSISFIISFEPSKYLCIVMETMPSISSSIVYVSLLVKTNRIARLLALTKKKFPNPHPKFVSLKAQFIITFVLIVIMVVVSMGWTLCDPPHVRQFYNTDDEGVHAVLECAFSGNIVYFCLCYKMGLITLGTYYAFKTRHIPDNFREAKCIGFLMYVIWVSSIAHAYVYFGSDLKMLAVSTHVSTNGLAVLVLIFSPKLYIILFVPHKNTREHFTTTNEIRFTIGRPEILANQRFVSIEYPKKQIETVQELYKQQIIK